MRKSNFELLRIIAILMVLVVHANFATFGVPTCEDIARMPFISYVRFWLQFISVSCVNIFVLISGYFGIKPKMKSVLGFLFILCFWRTALLLMWPIVGGGRLVLNFDMINPIRGWFIESYLGLLLIAPVLNAAFEKMGVVRVLKFLLVFFAIQFTSEFFLPFWKAPELGYSILSFSGLYLLGRCVGAGALLRLRGLATFRNIFIGVSSYTLLVLLIVVGANRIAMPHGVTDFITGRTISFFTAYSSPAVILLGLLFVLRFEKIGFSSRVINHLSMSVFPIYLAHVLPYYATTLRTLCMGNEFWLFMVKACCFLLVIVIATMMFDQLRIVMWKSLTKLWGK